MIDTRIFADPGQKNKLSPLQRQFLKMQIVKIVDRARQRADVTQQRSLCSFVIIFTAILVELSTNIMT